MVARQTKRPKTKRPKPVEFFTSNPSIIAHVKWLMGHNKQKDKS